MGPDKESETQAVSSMSTVIRPGCPRNKNIASAQSTIDGSEAAAERSMVAGRLDSATRGMSVLSVPRPV